MKFNKFIYSKYYNLIKYSVFIFFIFFIIFEINSNFNFVYSKLFKNLPVILFILSANVIYQNVLSLRIYFVIKVCTRFNGSFIEWLKIYFESLIFNVLVSHTGSAYRATELKKKNVAYKEFLGIYYISYLSYLTINLLLIVIELSFLKFVSKDFKIFTLIGFFLIFLITFLTPSILSIFINLLKNFKFKILDKIFNNLKIILNFIKKSFFSFKLILILIIFGFLTHFFEILLFYLSYNFFIDNFKIEIMILLFAVSFLLDRMPVFSTIPGVSETIFAGISIPFGLFFYEGFLIKLLLRITAYLSICINSIIAYVLNYNNTLKKW